MINTKLLAVALAALAATAVSCKGFLDVENPGPIDDKLLQTPDAIPSLVTGMSADLSEELDDWVRLTSVATDELAHGGSYAGEGLWYRGTIRPDDVNGQWSDMHRARFEAETGIERIKGMQGIGGYDFNTSLQYARANLYAGLTNRILGEAACEAVINNGPAEANTVHFSRAEPYFTEAIRVASAISGATDVLRAAYGGRASVRAWQGNWAGAVSDAQQIPTNFVFNAIYSINSTRERNELFFETNNRREYTVFNTAWAQVFGDPRVLWDTIYTGTGASRAIQKGQDGLTNFFRQRKYADLGADIALVRGTEMLILRAENELRNGTIAAAFTLINQQRAFHNMAALPVAANLTDAWRVLGRERGAVTWLEARRIWDMRRWYAEGGDPRTVVLERIPSWATRDKCIPISREELQTNPNLRDRTG
jgi:starch-binding outer membrane protein, SusD/RagB family